MNAQKKLQIFPLCVLMFTACSTLATVSGTPGSSDLAVPDNSAATTVTAIGTAIQASGTLVTQDPTQVVASTLTNVQPSTSPIPTMTGDDRASFIQKMIRTNGGCRLPCWWGNQIVPGKTSFSDILQMFTDLGIPFSHIDADKGNLIASFEVPFSTTKPNYDYETVLKITRQGQQVWSIQVDGVAYNPNRLDQSPEYSRDWQERYGWSEILTEQGPPSEYYMYMDRSGSIKPAYFWLVVLFKKLGMALVYTGHAEIRVPNKVTACPHPSEVTKIQIYLISPEDGEKLASLILTGPDYSKYSSSGLGVSPEEFYNIFKTNGATRCFEQELSTTNP